MKEIRITEKISILEGYREPLSADVGVIHMGNTTWLYDVGNGEEMLRYLPIGAKVVISHFHADHLGNLKHLQYEDLFVSLETYKHTGCGKVVSDELTEAGVRIFPLPSCHAKGCLGLEIENTYAFVGDGLYSKRCQTGYLFNQQVLKSEIAVLKSIKAEKLLVSHYPGLLRDKAEVIAELEEIYAMRSKDSCEIIVPFQV